MGNEKFEIADAIETLKIYLSSTGNLPEVGQDILDTAKELLRSQFDRVSALKQALQNCTKYDKIQSVAPVICKNDEELMLCLRLQLCCLGILFDNELKNRIQ